MKRSESTESGFKSVVSVRGCAWFNLIVSVFSLQHSTPPSAYGSVKPYTNFDAERDALNIETAVKTKGRHCALSRPSPCQGGL
jgi:hypothetical protein